MTEPATAVPALGNTPAAPRNPADARANEFVDYPRDQWDRPLIAVLDPDGKPFPNLIKGQLDRYETPIPWISEPYIRASTAGSALEHEGGINSWRTRQAVIGFMARPDLFALAKTVDDPGAAGRSELDKRIKEAQTVAGSGAAANEGTAGHAFAEKYDRGQVLPPLDEALTGWLKTYAHLTANWAWEHIEARLVCPALRMAGRTDRIGRPPGYMIAPDGSIIGPADRVVVDLKTSSSSKYFGIKFAIQLAVYGYGDLYDPATGEFTPTGARRDWALVLHIPSGATSGSWWWVNIRAGYELAQLANTVLGARKRKDLVAQAGQVYGTLDEALAAGGVLHEPGRSPLIAGPADRLTALAKAADVMISDASCEIHGSHGGTVDCPNCLEEWKAWRADNGYSGQFVGPGDSFESWRAGRLQLIADGHPDPTTPQPLHGVPWAPDPVESGARNAGVSPDPVEVAATAEVTGESEHEVEARAFAAAVDQQTREIQAVTGAPVRPEPSDPTTWSPDLGRKLQAAHEARQDPEAQRRREILAVASAPPRGGLEAVRQRYALTWTDEHQAAFERRGWELGILAALERSTTVDNLVAVHTMCAGWNAWTDEFERVASRRAAEISKGDG